jgi:5'-nucleotidase
VRRLASGGLVRILITNDDGVRAPGIAALATATAQTGHEVVVVAPLIDYSGSGAAVGPIHSRAGVDYESHVIEGLGDIPTYGIDGPPALAVILACVGGFGPRPDMVLSGINHGINVGRSAMHSGTVGAALTGAHFGLRCLAVSIRWGDDPVPWETPATLATHLVSVLECAPPGTTLNLNAPNVGLGHLRGLRHGRLGRGGTIRSAVHDTDETGKGVPLPHVALPPGQTGTLRLDLSAPGSSSHVHPDTDVGLLVRDYASLTPLVGVREAGADADDVLDAALEALYRLPGVSAGVDPDEQPAPPGPGREDEAATA